jgi:hypothetical protein
LNGPAFPDGFAIDFDLEAGDPEKRPLSVVPASNTLAIAGAGSLVFCARRLDPAAGRDNLETYPSSYTPAQQSAPVTDERGNVRRQEPRRLPPPATAGGRGRAACPAVPPGLAKTAVGRAGFFGCSSCRARLATRLSARKSCGIEPFPISPASCVLKSKAPPLASERLLPPSASVETWTVVGEPTHPSAAASTRGAAKTKSAVEATPSESPPEPARAGERSERTPGLFAG